MLYGDPSAEGVFAMRLKLPAGFAIPPHSHPQPEVVTVISGVLHYAGGAEEGGATLASGDFFAVEPGHVHHVNTDDGAVLQLNSVGPWEIEYVDPADDPRN